MSLILSILVALFSSHGLADKFDDLKKEAAAVPHSEIDKEIKKYISKETNLPVDKMTSHYTLALYERKSEGKSWYILDGYYEFETGELLFLDFVYFANEKKWQAIDNYRYYVPVQYKRHMLRAEEKCNPYKRNYIGILKAKVSPEEFLKLQKYIQTSDFLNTLYTLDGSSLTMVEKPNWRQGDSVLHLTLNEKAVVSELKKELGISAEVVLSGRKLSDEKLTQTYVASTKSCEGLTQ